MDHRPPPPWRPDFAAGPASHHIADLASRLTGAHWPGLDRLNVLACTLQLRNAAGLPITFAPQEMRCGQRDYEAGILATGVVPTREQNWHDLFNALTWLSFPRTKAALNAIQCEALRIKGERRGDRSDAATLLDESGLVIVAPGLRLQRRLVQRCWREAFVEHRRDWAEAQVYVFGHAILEKLLTPWPGITAKCLFLEADAPPAGAPPDWLDSALAEICRGDDLTDPARLFPVPVLGIPGWWPANREADFYDDARVFRPLRRV